MSSNKSKAPLFRVGDEVVCVESGIASSVEGSVTVKKGIRYIIRIGNYHYMGYDCVGVEGDMAIWCADRFAHIQPPPPISRNLRGSIQCLPKCS